MNQEDKKELSEGTEKKAYTPPSIKIVKLDTEVMLKTNCKTASGGGKPGRTCNTGGSGGGCANNAAGS